MSDEPSGLELDTSKPRARPVMYNLDPPVHTQNNQHYPERPNRISDDGELEKRKTKVIVTALVGLGAGMAATVFITSTAAVTAIALGAALLAWECVEVGR